MENKNKNKDKKNDWKKENKKKHGVKLNKRAKEVIPKWMCWLMRRAIQRGKKMKKPKCQSKVYII